MSESISTIRSTLQSAWTWAALLTLIVVWLPVLALVRLFDRDPARYHTGFWFRRLGRLMTRVNPAWRIQVDGVEVPDPRRPYLVVCNHQSFADIPVVSRLPWEMKWVAKKELFGIPFVGWMMRLAGDIPLDRGDRRSGALALMKARDYLNLRCSVIFFPEGTRSRDGRVGPFSDGPFRLAVREAITILPVAVDGTYDALPKHSWRFGEARLVRLRVLEPVSTDARDPRESAVLRDEVRTRIVNTIAQWRGVPPSEIDSPREDVPLDDSLRAPGG